METMSDQSYLMSGHANKLKDRLKIEFPSLYDALARSWTIARNEWLPALGVKYDSYNSFPHINSLEYYLEEVILKFEEQADHGKPFITPIEIYIIYCAILFHDIGHIFTSIKGKKKCTHAQASKDIINDKWNELGICSIELANSIAKICAYHDCYGDGWATEQRENLNNVVIDPYGEIREHWLACLLVLVDHMDGAYTRVLPKYMRSGRSLKVVGAFRNVIRGIKVDPERQMIITLIGDDLVKEALGSVKESKYKYSFNNEPNNKYLEITKNIFNNIPKKVFIEKDIKELIEDQIYKEIVTEESQEIVLLNGKLVNLVSKTAFSISDWLVLRQIFYVELKPSSGVWSKNKLIAMILGDVIENNIALGKIKDTLTENGINIKDWVIDCRERIFNIDGEETIEPIFSKDYLVRVVESMWKLSSTILNPGDFSYETLASSLRDPDINHVKLAVRRISIISRDTKSIKASDKYWKWSCLEKEVINEVNPTKKVKILVGDINDLKSRISELKESNTTWVNMTWGKEK